MRAVMIRLYYAMFYAVLALLQENMTLVVDSPILISRPGCLFASVQVGKI